MVEQILYVSRAVGADFSKELPAILTCARRNNPELGITGLLVVDGSACLQVLEGEPEHLHPLLGMIRDDPRHTEIEVVAQRHVRARDFPDWAMGYADAEAGEGGPDLSTDAHKLLSDAKSSNAATDGIELLDRVIAAGLSRGAGA